MAYVGDADRRRDALTFGMLAETLLHAELLHLLRVMLWGAASVIAGTAVFVLLLVRRAASPLLRSFGGACLVLGGLELLGAGISYHAAPLRDYYAAVRLDRTVWFELGFAAAALLAAVAFAIEGWRIGRRLGVVGASVAVALHSLAILLLDLQLAFVISR